MRPVGLAGDELGELGGERDVGGLGDVEQGQLVEHVGEPLALLFPVEVDAPQRVVERLGSHGHLGGEGLLGEMAQRTAHLEVLAEVVFPVDAEHGLPRLAVVGIAFRRHLHLRPGVEDALVEDGDLAGRIVDGVVAAFGEGDAAGCHHHRTLGHVVGAERDDVGRRATELAHEHILVFFGYLLGDGLRGVVEFGIAVFFCGLGCYSLRDEEFIEVFAERLHLGQEDAPVADGVAAHVVEIAVGVHLHVVVEPVGVDVLDEGLVLHLGLGDVGEVDACRVALELDVEAELVFLYRRGEVVDVLHHQVPVALRGVVAGVFQRLHKQAFRDIGDVAGKLAYLVGDAAVGVFEGDGEHLVGLECGLERHVSQGSVEGVFRRRQEAGALEFLIVDTAYVTGVEHGRRLVDVAGFDVCAHHLAVDVIGAIRGGEVVAALAE